jgi:uncharacterized membrane protein YgaE (UPF0421/DUF939 family)
VTDDEPTRASVARARMARRLEDLPPREELLEQAAEASRAGLQRRGDRILHTARPILHTSLAAAIAWLVATELVGHSQPFFAPVAAVITLGLTVGQRGRRAIEMAIGVALGIFVADAMVAGIGTGTWQIAVVTLITMLAATLVGGGPLLATQAGVSAVLVATLQPPDGGFSFARLVDSLVGGGVALVVSAVILPVDPLALARAGTEPLIARLAAALEEIADALEARDIEGAERALVTSSDVQLDYERLEEHLAAAGDTARVTPGRRDRRQRLARYRTAARETGLALANIRVLARAASRAITLDDVTPPEVPAAVRELAASVRELGAHLDGRADQRVVRDPAIHAAGLANGVLQQTDNLSALHIVGQVRLIAVDLLRATGMERGAATDSVRAAMARVEA